MGAVVVKAMRDIGTSRRGRWSSSWTGKAGSTLEVNTRSRWSTPSRVHQRVRHHPEDVQAGGRRKADDAQKDVLLRGHSIQCRVNAEDPRNNFTPSFGKITFLRQISGPFVRHESGSTRDGSSPYYDSLLQDLLGGERPETAIQRMQRALREFDIGGVSTTIPC